MYIFLVRLAFDFKSHLTFDLVEMKKSATRICNIYQIHKKSPLSFSCKDSILIWQWQYDNNIWPSNSFFFLKITSSKVLIPFVQIFTKSATLTAILLQTAFKTTYLNKHLSSSRFRRTSWNFGALFHTSKSYCLLNLKWNEPNWRKLFTPPAMSTLRYLYL